jgi:signal transduction histidine kinase
MDRWAIARDGERFTAECRVIVAMIEQKMERYETALGRLRDTCARDHGEISSRNWSGWLDHILDVGHNYPNARVLLVAPKISRADREDFGRRAVRQDPGHPGTIITTRPDAAYWAPMWRRSVRGGIEAPVPGDDLLAESPAHPSFEPALRVTFGWVAAQPSRLPSTQRGEVTGFWFVLPLRPTEFAYHIAWQGRDESLSEAMRRRAVQRTEQATGLLAAFLARDDFMEQFNHADALVRVQLFASREPAAEALLNPSQVPPPNARFTQDHLMAWYGRRWTARFHSAPAFEAGSLRYRAALVWWLGIPLSLAGAGAMAWQARSRWREAALAEQLREALGRQERLSRDLHDGTLQSVYGIGLALQRTQRLLEKRPTDAARQIAETTGALQRVLGELRDFVRQTDPGTREDVPLGEALAGVVAHQRLGAEMKLDVEVKPGGDRGLSAAQSLQLLNIAREALSNSIRHSGGRHVRITLEQRDGIVRLEVADDGCGFDPAMAQNRGRGLGNLAARVRELGGNHQWKAAHGAGCQLIVEIPVNFAANPPA